MYSLPQSYNQTSKCKRCISSNAYHYTIDIYDNAMLVLAIDNFLEMTTNEGYKSKWGKVKNELAQNIRKHLWDKEKQKFIPHIYLNGSPFPQNFDEKENIMHIITDFCSKGWGFNRPFNL